MKTVGEKVAMVSRGIQHRARKRFSEGRFDNPFAEERSHLHKTSRLRQGMYQQFEEEMDKMMTPIDRTGFTTRCVR